MERELEGRQGRQVRVHTTHGTIEGRISTNPGISTLHFVNVVATSQNFFTVHPPVRCDPEGAFEEGALAVAAESILFLVELSDYVPRPGDPEEAARFTRASVRLQVADHLLEGFVHVPPGGDPIARLNQDRHPFIALTSASVLGPESEFAAPFVAVNRSYILAVQHVRQELPDEESRVAELTTES